MNAPGFATQAFSAKLTPRGEVSIDDQPVYSSEGGIVRAVKDCAGTAI